MAKPKAKKKKTKNAHPLPKPVPVAYEGGQQLPAAPVYVFGRPTKYKPEYCMALINHCKQGYSYESFSGTIGVALQTLYDWEKAHQDFLEAKKVARTLQRKELETIGLLQARGDPKVKGGSAATLIFFMKNCLGWQDNPGAIAEDYDAMEFEFDEAEEG